MLWGSRFKQKLSSEALSFSSSLHVDIRLYKHDILISIAHAKMLERMGILSPDELISILDGLQKIKYEFESGGWSPNVNEFEDIHSAIEKRLTLHVGELGGKLQTGRSRNDQIATAVRLWQKAAIESLNLQTTSLQKELINLAEKHIETIIPGYTHLQRAQPVSLGFHLLVYVEMLQRSKERFNYVYFETDSCPLGSGALAGSTLPIDREFTAKELGFSSVTQNALDSVSNRDFIVDFLNACAAGMMNLSRLAEELIIWSTSEWNFIKFSDEYSTGSSLMPQKKNPDIAELIRGKAGRAFGNYVALVTTIKGLPLSYNRDLQEDKEPLFDSFDTYSNSLKMMNSIISSIEVNKARFSDELDGDFSLATDLADWLVLRGVPFRKAHEIVGQVVNYSEEQNKKLNQLSVDEIKNINPVFDETVQQILSIKNALNRKKTLGSPNPDLVLKQIKSWKDRL